MMGTTERNSQKETRMSKLLVNERPLDQKLCHAQHYLGSTTDLEQRLKEV